MAHMLLMGVRLLRVLSYHACQKRGKAPPRSFPHPFLGLHAVRGVSKSRGQVYEGGKSISTSSAAARLAFSYPVDTNVVIRPHRTSDPSTRLPSAYVPVSRHAWIYMESDVVFVKYVPSIHGRDISIGRMTADQFELALDHVLKTSLLRRRRERGSARILLHRR